jgi:L-asparaginase
VFEENLLKRDKSMPLKVHKELDTSIGLLKIFPGIRPGFMKHFLSTPELKGLVLETFGSGNAPSEDWFVNALETSIKSGLIIVNVTQCSGGSVAMGQYETSERLKQIGLISGKDITTESALAKMMFLMPKYNNAKDFKINFERAVCGEISEN